jgi:Mg-chelatase subunit ChlD
LNSDSIIIRLNNKFIKAVTSEYKYKKCFSMKIRQKELKILLLVDISGSMSGIKLEAAEIAMIMLCEAI